MDQEGDISIYRLGGRGPLEQRILAQSVEWRLHWLLRFGAFMEFVGHGAFGLKTKAGWLPYFHVFAISDDLAWRLMPLIGAIDIALGLTTLLAPRRALLLYMAAWGCFTALLRPAAGEGGWEFIERAYNFGVAAALLFLHGAGRDWRSWREPLRTVPRLSPERARTMVWALRAVVALMLIGHGGFGAFMAKKNLLGFYAAAGLGAFGLPLETIRAAIGFFEIGLGVASLSIKRPGFFLLLFAWKLGSELLYVVADANGAWWEVMERGASYVAPLAGLCLCLYLANLRRLRTVVA